VPSFQKYSGFQTGLFTAAGKAKPSFDGFRLPLAVRQTSSKRVSIWGLVRPVAAPTTATIEYEGKSGGWHKLMDVQADARGYFTKSGTLVSGRQWRLVWTAPNGTTYRGSPTRAYKP
jgi:hypothetical protein